VGHDRHAAGQALAEVAVHGSPKYHEQPRYVPVDSLSTRQ
jgi:hypothetical protein